MTESTACSRSILMERPSAPTTTSAVTPLPAASLGITAARRSRATRACLFIGSIQSTCDPVGWVPVQAGRREGRVRQCSRMSPEASSEDRRRHLTHCRSSGLRSTTTSSPSSRPRSSTASPIWRPTERPTPRSRNGYLVASRAILGLSARLRARYVCARILVRSRDTSQPAARSGRTRRLFWSVSPSY
jgi:hypothetical protein